MAAVLQPALLLQALADSTNALQSARECRLAGVYRVWSKHQGMIVWLSRAHEYPGTLRTAGEINDAIIGELQ